MSRAGRQTLVFERPPRIAARYSLVGPKEGQGPLADEFDEILEDDLLEQRSWEFAESEMLRRCAVRAMNEGGVVEKNVQAFLSGDLNDQLLASSFAARRLSIMVIRQARITISSMRATKKYRAPRAISSYRFRLMVPRLTSRP